MIDLGYVGNQFTWRHGLNVETRRAARLDRILCCDDWKRLFLAAVVKHIGYAHSDHCLLQLEVNGVGEAKLGVWLMHPDFLKMMEKEWRWSGDLTCSLKCFTEKLAAWNKDTFGNVFKRKRRLRRRREGVERALDQGTSVGLLKLESGLKRE